MVLLLFSEAPRPLWESVEAQPDRMHFVMPTQIQATCTLASKLRCDSPIFEQAVDRPSRPCFSKTMAHVNIFGINQDHAGSEGIVFA